MSPPICAARPTLESVVIPVPVPVPAAGVVAPPSDVAPNVVPVVPSATTAARPTLGTNRRGVIRRRSVSNTVQVRVTRRRSERLQPGF